MTSEPEVLRVRDIGWNCLQRLLQPAGLNIQPVDDGIDIPGSHWGDAEAGLIRHSLYARTDTPVHSVLHEAGHWLLMNAERRAALHTDARGSAIEEMAVCYLQVLLAELIPGMGSARMCTDMDRWGYSFRLGDTRSWLREDAEDALAYLTEKLPHTHGVPGLQIRTPCGSVLQQHDDG